MSLQALIHVRERNMAEKDRRIADIEKEILDDIEEAKAAKRREQAEHASPRSISVVLFHSGISSCTTRRCA